MDNTTRENKNAAMLAYLSWIVAMRGFRLAALVSSRVGHTHNRLGTTGGRSKVSCTRCVSCCSIWVCILMGRRARRVRVGVCFAGMFRGLFRGYVSGLFRGILSYFTCNFGRMLRGMFRGYVSGYVSVYVSRFGCATRVPLLKPEPPKKKHKPTYFKSPCGSDGVYGLLASAVRFVTEIVDPADLVQTLGCSLRSSQERPRDPHDTLSSGKCKRSWKISIYGHGLAQIPLSKSRCFTVSGIGTAGSLEATWV